MSFDGKCMKKMKKKKKKSWGKITSYVLGCLGELLPLRNYYTWQNFMTNRINYYPFNIQGNITHTKLTLS